jgi:hypothetical protein
MWKYCALVKYMTISAKRALLEVADMNICMVIVESHKQDRIVPDI